MNRASPASPAPEAPSAEVVLNFSCPACAMALSVPVSQAGVTGPCPGCGASITAPPATPQAAPIEIKPRPSVTKSAAKPPEAAPDPAASEVPSPPQPAIPPSRSDSGEAAASGPADPGGIPPRKKKHRHRPGRALDPHTGLSREYSNDKDAHTVIKIAIAFVLTVLVVFGVFSFLKREFHREDPAPLFEDELSL